jgi:cytochrome c-type biogenesis protein CcmE
MRIRPRFLIGAGLIVAAIAYLIVAAIRTTSEYYLTVEEVSAREPDLKGQSLRIAGRVVGGTIAWEPSTLTLKFAMAPIPDGTGAAVKPVSAAGAVPPLKVIAVGEPKPDMFAPGRDVIVEGRLGDGGVVNATQVMTSCPSKYRPAQAK